MSLIGWVEMSAYLDCPGSETAALLPAELGLGGGGEQQQQGEEGEQAGHGAVLAGVSRRD